MENFKETVIKNPTNNGVNHEVEIRLDGTITAHKYIAGDKVQTYDWSYMSASEVYETARQSGHYRYIIREEVPTIIEQDRPSKAIRKLITDAIAENEDAEIKVVFDTAVGEGNVDVSLVVYVDGEMAVDKLVANSEYVNEINVERAERIRERLANRFVKRYSTI